MKRRVPKTLKRIVITVIAMLLLFVGGGVAYVYLTGKSGPVQDDVTTVANTEDSSPLPKPVAPSPNAPEGVAINALTSPVKAGTNASANVATNAGSKCTIIVTYGGVVSTDSGLAPKQANDYGSVTWTWTVGEAVAPGTGTVKVTCVYNGRTGLAISNQVINK